MTIDPAEHPRIRSRVAAGISQSAIARSLGVSPSTINKIVTRRTKGVKAGRPRMEEQPLSSNGYSYTMHMTKDIGERFTELVPAGKRATKLREIVTAWVLEQEHG